MVYHADASARSPPLTERVQSAPAHPYPRAATSDTWSMAKAPRMVGMRPSNGSPW